MTTPGADARRDDAGWQPGLVDLYRERYVDLARLAYLMTGRTDIADEIVQDAFVACNGSWDGRRPPFPYVRAAVVNRSRSWHRRNGVERRHRPQPSPPAYIEPDELWDVLDTLKERARTAIVLRFYEGLPDAEIALHLDCAEATVRTTIHRALHALRKELK